MTDGSRGRDESERERASAGLLFILYTLYVHISVTESQVKSIRYVQTKREWG